jgi:hypothetical protein
VARVTSGTRRPGGTSDVRNAKPGGTSDVRNAKPGGTSDMSDVGLPLGTDIPFTLDLHY